MGTLLNVVGLGTAIALYGMLLAMVLRDGRTSLAQRGTDPLLLATAALGLTWNLCALPAFALARLGITRGLPLFTLIGTSALGFLPAVVVHSVLRGSWRHRYRASALVLLLVAYGAAFTASVLHVRAFWRGDALPSPAAMELLTIVFLSLLVPVGVVTRTQQRSRRALWMAALSAFAVSAVHLSQPDPVNPSWFVELVGHHASLPLAIAILYQDFPFAFADLFLKRALTLLTMVPIPLLSMAVIGTHPPQAAVSVTGPRAVAALLAVWLLSLPLYPRLKAVSEWFVDAVILRRPDYRLLRRRLAAALQERETEQDALEYVCGLLAPALNADVVRWRKTGAPIPQRRDAARATIDVAVTEAPAYVIDVADVKWGRRLLSDDYAFLDAVAALVARRIDAIRMTRERLDRVIREQQVSKLATEAELKALRAQVDPHFLFNALTTIGYLIQTSPPRAVRTLMQLTSLLRRVLRSDGEFTTLERELELIAAYLDIERARFERRLRVAIDVSPAAKQVRIPPLILQPLVENAIKHGIAQKERGGDISVTGRLETGAYGDSLLILAVRDTGIGASDAQLRHGRSGGVGLNNVERRLACYYGDRAVLTIRSEVGVGTSVWIQMPAEVSMATVGERTA